MSKHLLVFMRHFGIPELTLDSTLGHRSLSFVAESIANDAFSHEVWRTTNIQTHFRLRNIYVQKSDSETKKNL